MKKNKILLLVLCVVFVAGIMGCSQQPKTANSKEAIAQAKSLATAQEKAKYLLNEANAFINSEKFEDSIRITKYVLSKVDKNSVDAKTLLEKAQVELKAYAVKKAEEAKAALKEKMGSLGK